VNRTLYMVGMVCAFARIMLGQVILVFRRLSGARPLFYVIQGLTNQHAQNRRILGTPVRPGLNSILFS
jgi:hypothetical protein